MEPPVIKHQTCTPPRRASQAQGLVQGRCLSDAITTQPTAVGLAPVWTCQTARTVPSA
jgi:hypothetical protein